ncbi:MAG: CPBP family intramembrane metalloprotease [Phycisphaerales bacterium]|nr:CPBP family intramembrane metalloprotease [Phycisphaerales bacterium]
MLEKITKLTAKQKALLALVLILPAPLIGVSSSFYMPSIRAINTHEIEIGKVIWAFAKIWLVVLPVVWLLYIDRGKISWSPTNKNGVFAGLIWSIPVAFIIFGTYLLSRDSLLDQDAKATIGELGISSPANFLIFASAMSLVNSLIEEYVWRWFVFSKFRVLVRVWPAIILSSFFFTVHHVVIMWNFGSLWLVFLGSVGLFSGGVIWGWLYNKYNSIWPGWICHVAADTALMWISWRIITSD